MWLKQKIQMNLLTYLILITVINSLWIAPFGAFVCPLGVPAVLTAQSKILNLKHLIYSYMYK